MFQEIILLKQIISERGKTQKGGERIAETEKQEKPYESYPEEGLLHGESAGKHHATRDRG